MDKQLWTKQQQHHGDNVGTTFLPKKPHISSDGAVTWQVQVTTISLPSSQPGVYKSSTEVQVEEVVRSKMAAKVDEGCSGMRFQSSRPLCHWIKVPFYQIYMEADEQQLLHNKRNHTQMCSIKMVLTHFSSRL